MYLADGIYGYEITQADLDEDLNHKRLFRMMQESNYLFESLKSKALFENFELGQYSFITNSNGYIVSISSSDKYFGKERFYFLSVLQKILKRNYKKFNKGNYSKCDKVFLIVETFGRFKTLDDIKIICNSNHDLD